MFLPGSGSDFQISLDPNMVSAPGSGFEKIMDPDPVCPYRVDPDPVNIRPDPKP